MTAFRRNSSTHDATIGSLPQHLFSLAMSSAGGQVLQALYLLVDIHYVAKLGSQSLAGVGAAGSVAMLMQACSQVLGIGTGSLIAQAAGRKNNEELGRLVSESLIVSIGCALVVLLLLYPLTGFYVRLLLSDGVAIEEGQRYLFWLIPGLAVQFVFSALRSGLRGTGAFSIVLRIQLISFIQYTVTCPILALGWITERPMGAAGAGLANSLSVFASLLAILVYYSKLQTGISLRPRLRSLKIQAVRRIVRIGIPSGGELILQYVYVAVTYYLVQGFGHSVQAGFATGVRIIQVLTIPVFAVAWALAVIVGQNFGANQIYRIRAGVRDALISSTLLSVAISILFFLHPDWLIHWFSDDDEARRWISEFLSIYAWGILSQGVVAVCTGVCQGIGRTTLSFWGSATRLLTFVLPALMILRMFDAGPSYIWWAASLSMIPHAMVSLFIIRYAIAGCADLPQKLVAR